MELLRGVSRSLGLDEGETEAGLGMASRAARILMQRWAFRPRPFYASDSERRRGLKIQRNGRWINVNALPNSLLVNTGDHLQIFSNGKYKSVLHRAVVNDQRTRISVAMANGPSRDTVVCPAPELVRAEGCVPAYVPIKYGDYLLAQQSNQLDGKSILKRVKIDED